MRILALPEVDGPPLTVRLRDVTGADEAALAPEDPGAAVALLSRVATLADGSTPDLPPMTVTRADRLLAEVYDMLYGPRAECRTRCTACGEGYEFTLELPALVAAQDAERPEAPAPDGSWTLPDGRRLRAPRLGDVATGDPDALLARLVIAGDATADPGAVAAFLERAAPTLTLDLDLRCAHCGAAQVVRFDLGRYLTRRLANERPFLLRETHLIASRYSWSHAEIMALPREDRRAHAGLIEAERAAMQRRRAG